MMWKNAKGKERIRIMPKECLKMSTLTFHQLDQSEHPPCMTIKNCSKKENYRSPVFNPWRKKLRNKTRERTNMTLIEIVSSPWYPLSETK